MAPKAAMKAMKTTMKARGVKKTAKPKAASKADRMAAIKKWQMQALPTDEVDDDASGSGSDGGGLSAKKRPAAGGAIVPLCSYRDTAYVCYAIGNAFRRIACKR